MKQTSSFERCKKLVSWLKKNKKNIVIILLSALIPFAITQNGVNPFVMAFIGALVVLKIPIAIPFLITSILSFVSLGLEGFTETVVFTLIFALVQAFWKKKDGQVAEFIKYLGAITFTEVLLFVVNVHSFDNFINIVINMILSLGFFIVFKNGINNLYGTGEKLKKEEVLATIVLFIVAVSVLKNISIFDITLLSLVCTVFVMIYAYKKPVLFGIVSALIVAIILGIFQKLVLLVVLMMVVISIIVSLLSIIGKKGSVIGFAFSGMMLLITLFKIENTAGVHTLASMALAQMFIGFLILLALPEGFYEYFSKFTTKNEKIRVILEKLFPKMALYRLSAGKEDKNK